MRKKFVFPVFIVSILLILALYQASAQYQPTSANQNNNPSANAGWEEVGIGSAAGGGISNNSGKSAWPSMVIDNSDNVFVSWNDDTTGIDQIYSLRWNGVVWEEYGGNSASEGGITNSEGKSVAPFMAIDPLSSQYCITWRDWTSGNAETYYNCWPTWPGNDEWNEIPYEGGISNQQGQTLSFPSMYIDSNPQSHPLPKIAWNESDGNDQEIYLAALDYQLGWIVTELSNNNGDSWSPSVAGVGLPGSFDPTYVAWHDYSNDENAAEIYIRTSYGAEVGANSASGGGISNTPGESSSANLVASIDGHLFVAWEDDTNGNYEIYVRHWNGYQWSELGTGSASGGGISNNSGDSFRPRLALDPNGNPYIAWFDNSSGNYEIYARRWNGLTWEEVGYGSTTGGGISSNAGVSGYLDLAIDSNGVPYVVWDDDSSGNQEIYVRRYSGQSPPTPTNTPLPTLTPTASQTPIPPTATATSIPTATQTPPPNSTSTPTTDPSATSTPQPSTTSSPTNTPQPPGSKITLPLIIHQPTPTHTPTPTQTPLPTNTPPPTPPPTPIPTQPPLFVGLQARWDGEGFIRWGNYYNPGTHEVRNATEMIDADVIKIHAHLWYDPNPIGWEDDTWNSYYRVSNGVFQSSDAVSNPAWKWGYWWLLPYPMELSNNETILIDGERFTVTGPHSGYTTFGQHMFFWQFVNQEKFLMLDSGGEFIQFVHPGEAILRYDIQTKLLVYDNIKRTVYEDGDQTDFTVQYISNLTSSNAYPASSKNVLVEDTILNTLEHQVEGNKPGLMDNINK